MSGWALGSKQGAGRGLETPGSGRRACRFQLPGAQVCLNTHRRALEVPVSRPFHPLLLTNHALIVSPLCRTMPAPARPHPLPPSRAKKLTLEEAEEAMRNPQAAAAAAAGAAAAASAAAPGARGRGGGAAARGSGGGIGGSGLDRFAPKSMRRAEREKADDAIRDEAFRAVFNPSAAQASVYTTLWGCLRGIQAGLFFGRPPRGRLLASQGGCLRCIPNVVVGWCADRLLCMRFSLGCVCFIGALWRRCGLLTAARTATTIAVIRMGAFAAFRVLLPHGPVHVLHCGAVMSVGVRSGGSRSVGWLWPACQHIINRFQSPFVESFQSNTKRCGPFSPTSHLHQQLRGDGTTYFAAPIQNMPCTPADRCHGG